MFMIDLGDGADVITGTITSDGDGNFTGDCKREFQLLDHGSHRTSPRNSCENTFTKATPVEIGAYRKGSGTGT